MPWQHALSPKRTALVSAALRHVDDATALLASSPVQAFHLAGFGPECARKAALTVPEASQIALDKAIGHGFHDVTELALAIAINLDPLASRYELTDWQTRFPAMVKWNEQARYEASDGRSRREAEVVLREAADAVSDVVAALWADGRLPPLNHLTQVRP